MGDYNDTFMRNQQNAAVQGRTKVQNRANVQQLKLIGQSHPTGLTTNLLKLFEPRPPLEFKPPPEKRKCPPLSGMAQFVSRFAEPGDAEYSPPVKEAETPVQRRARVHMLRLEKGAEKATEELQKYNPNEDQNISGDPYKTLFVARLSYETTESRIKREFESYGPIKRAVKNIAADEEISCLSATLAGGDASRDGKLYDLKVRVIADKESNKPRGYAFIEYVHTRDMKAAYKQADGRKIDGRRVLVDVERGRTVPNWRPRRLGGGLGTTRVGGEDVNQRYSGRDQPQSGGPPPPSEEPRAREDRHADRDREKSRERGRDREKEREKSGEHSHDRHRDREHREDRHHRDRDRDRDRERERDRGRDRARDRDRDRGRDRGRDHDRHRERDRERERGRDKESERDIDVEDHDREQGRSRDRESNYDRVESKHERDLHGEKERDYDHTEPEDDRGWYEQTEHGHKHPDQDLDPEQYEHHRSRGQYDRMDIQDDHDRYDQYPDRSRQYDRMDEDDYHYDRATSESRERERTRDLEREYRRSDRSLSREDKH